MISGLSRLRLLLVAIFAIVGAGLVSPGSLVGAAQPAGIAVVAHAVRWTAVHRAARAQACAARPGVDHDAVLVELADDDLVDDDVEHRGATRPHLANASNALFRGVRLSRRSGWDLRGHPQFDRPRFRTGRGLLRGPPA